MYESVHMIGIINHCSVLCFFFFFLAKPHQISVPWPGIEPKPWQWKPRILTTRLPGNSLSIFLSNSPFFLAFSFIVEYKWLTICVSFRCAAKWFSYTIYVSILLLKKFYLFMALLGLCCCMRAFSITVSGGYSSCGEQASHCGGFSRCKHRL